MKNVILWLVLISMVGCGARNTSPVPGRVEVSLYSPGADGVVFRLSPSGTVSADSGDFDEYGELYRSFSNLDDVIIVVQVPGKTSCETLGKLIVGIKTNVPPLRKISTNLNVRIALKPIYGSMKLDRQEDPLILGPENNSRDPRQEEPKSLEPAIEIP